MRTRPLRSFVAVLSLGLAAGCPAWLRAQDDPAPQGYKTPPEPIRSLVTAPEPPDVALSPDKRYLVFTERERMPGIEVLARPHAKLAGSRIDVPSRGRQWGTRTMTVHVRTLQAQPLALGEPVAVQVPAGQISGPWWSPDCARMAFARTDAAGIALWLADPTTGRAEQVQGVVLNAVLGAPVRWIDADTLLCRLRTDELLPAPPRAPLGPNVQATAGGKAQVRTNRDMLTSEHDAQLFEVVGRCQLARVDAATGAVTRLGEPDLYTTADPSPDGRFLLVAALERPFSYLVPWRQFPERTELWDAGGERVRALARQPLQDQVPIGGVPTGPRGIDWLPGREHTLLWTEALDGGDPDREVTHRDAVIVLTEPAGEPQTWLRTRHRSAGVQVAQDGMLALARQYDRKTRTEYVDHVDVGEFTIEPEVLYERSVQDAYGDPGRPVGVLAPDGTRRLLLRDGYLVLSGRGASKAGDRPFLRAWNAAGKNRIEDARTLWQSEAGRYETFVDFLDDWHILIRSESPTEPPNYHLVELLRDADEGKWGERVAVTQFADPAAAVAKQIHKELIRYQRADGVALSGTLYLPPGHEPGDKHPTLVWAYPQEFARAQDAGQVRGSDDRYVRLDGSSHLWLLLAGYAVLDGATMPVIGPVRTANDTYVEQLVAAAQAACDMLVARGVCDPREIAIAGHSYGAFMTANLLCHSDLFAAGIARSGAYNRTLTPFGFQNEERTFWQAPEVYLGMSPFAHADQLDEPLLLIHGEDDNNQGTWPLQSQRLFAAVKGHGGTAKLVMLPHESHGYRAEESVLHCLYEMVEWLDRHVKGRAARSGGAESGGGRR